MISAIAYIVIGALTLTAAGAAADHELSKTAALGKSRVRRGSLQDLEGPRRDGAYPLWGYYQPKEKPTMTRKTLSTVLAFGALALFAATQASAHAKLVRSDPAANATVAALKSIRLTFDEDLTPAFSGFDVVMGGSMKMPVRTTVSKDHKTIIGVLSGPAMAGAYKISWHAAAADDGHKTTGVLAFTVR